MQVAGVVEGHLARIAGDVAHLVAGVAQLEVAAIQRQPVGSNVAFGILRSLAAHSQEHIADGCQFFVDRQIAIGADADVARIVNACNGFLRAIGICRGQRTNLQITPVDIAHLARIAGDVSNHVAGVAQIEIATQQNQSAGVQLGVGIVGLSSVAGHRQRDDVIGTGFTGIYIVAMAILDQDAFGEVEIAARFEAYRLIRGDTGKVVHDTNRKVVNAREFEAADVGGNNTYVMLTLAELELAVAAQDQLVRRDGRPIRLRRAASRIDGKHQTVADLVIFVLALRIF